MAIKLIVHAQMMEFMVDVVPTDWVHRELVLHQMISNSLTLWQGMEASLSVEQLADIIVLGFRELFEA